MIEKYQNSFYPSDVNFTELDRNIESREVTNIPKLDELKYKLEDIFFKNSDELEKMDKFSVTSSEKKDYNTVSLDDGTVIEIFDTKVNETTNKVDDNGKIYIKEGELEPSITYELNGNLYTTDEKGRIISCISYPRRSPENPRDIEAQLQAGGENRKPNDQGGHIVGRDINGDGGVGNLIAMDSRINQSDYKRMENDVKNALDEGKEVTSKTEIIYTDNSQRPDMIITTVTVDGIDTRYKFDNNIDDSLFMEVPEYGKDVVRVEQVDTNGKISSIKEEYNQYGDLIETTVNITYTDENGVNHRTKVFITSELGDKNE